MFGIYFSETTVFQFDALAAGVFNPRTAERAQRERNREAKSEAKRNCVRGGVRFSAVYTIHDLDIVGTGQSQTPAVFIEATSTSSSRTAEEESSFASAL